jgi:mono/diheme cytochrome c family protein
MVLNSKLTETQDFHLSGLLLILVAMILGLALSGAIFVKDQEGRAAREAIAQRDSAPPPAALPAPAPPPASAAAIAPAAPPAPAAAAVPASVPAANPPVEAPAGPPVAAAAGSAAAGGAVFASNCGACHPNGGAGIGPTLLGLSDGAVTSGTRQGVGRMPAFTADRLSDQQLLDIIAFLSSTN